MRGSRWTSARGNCARAWASAEPEHWSEADRGAIGAVRRSEKSDSIQPVWIGFPVPPAGSLAAFADQRGRARPQALVRTRRLVERLGRVGAALSCQGFRGLADRAAMISHRIIRRWRPSSAWRRRVMGWRISIAVCGSRTTDRCRKARRRGNCSPAWRRSATYLAKLGLHFGASRQAIASPCRACAMCLYGCPLSPDLQCGRCGGARWLAAGTDCVIRAA
jgi:hypothetical protein